MLTGSKYDYHVIALIFFVGALLLFALAKCTDKPSPPASSYQNSP